jgi:hypothetical protein
VGEFAEKNGVDYTVASGFLRFLKEKGIVKEAGNRPAKGGKGKPSTLQDGQDHAGRKYARQQGK